MTQLNYTGRDLNDSTHLHPGISCSSEEIEYYPPLRNRARGIMTQKYRSLRGELPKSFFKPNPGRWAWVLGLWALSGLSVWWIVYGQPFWGTKLLLALVIGHCWGVGGLLAHEVMHGSVTRNRTLQNIVGFLEFIPFLISPTFWRFWHNNLHHSHTQRPIVDPDAYPTMRLFKQSRFAQWMFPFTPGSGRKRSYLYLFFWFSVNTQVAQFYFRFRNSAYKNLNHKKVNMELAAMLGLHGTFLWWAGPSQWLWVYFIPFLLQNYIPFSYISTNHNLSPLTKENDPLVNSLTVTNGSLWDFLHINFGYHVEHHLFPTMCHSHHKKLHGILKEKYPDTYQHMPKWEALKRLYQTARIYKKHKVLIHPKSEQTFGTIGYPLNDAQTASTTAEPQKKTEKSIESISGPAPAPPN